MSNATVSFLPWMRRGISTAITRRDDDPGTAPRAQVPVTITFDGNLGATASIDLVGPGEITGLDPRVVVRTYPAPETFNSEANYLALVELAQPDLPWRFTPTRASAGDRLRPWLCLIVVRDDEIEELGPGGGALPERVVIATNQVLPRLDQSWAWAHVQVSGADTVDAAAVRQLLASAPDRAVARLVCPRRLEAMTRYTALVVPAFERGRLAGLGQQVGAGIDALQPAWTASGDAVALPVYYRWQFGTGTAGDFEALVRLLQARQLAASVAGRPLDVAAPGAGLPAAAPGDLVLEGALTAVKVERAPLAGLRSDFLNQLVVLVDSPARLLAQVGARRVVAPPIYGRWHARREQVAIPLVGPPPWLDELNLDPRWRVAAGLGVQVVQAEQRPLLAAAWSQVEGIRAANERMRQAQLARAAAERIHARHLVGADSEQLVAVTGPVHAQVRTSPRTVRAALDDSPIVGGALEPQFRRVSRPLGPLGRRQGRAVAPQRQEVLGKLNRGDVRAAPPPVRIEKKPIPREPPPADRSHPDPPPAAPFRAAAHALLEQLRTPVPADPARTAVKLDGLRTRLVDALEPRAGFAASAAARIQIDASAAFRPSGDPLEPPLAAPSFPRPMYEALRALSPQWLLPGFDGVPPNSVVLLNSNPRFIESFMVGLNHEMARELEWNGYPTDLRGTYFRQFWDPAGYVGAPGVPVDPETLRDIRPIHTWAANRLGQNTSRATPPGGDHLVMLLRGEVLRQYPNTVLYAVKARLDAGKRVLGDDVRYPVFNGVLERDISFFGFELTAAEARGTTDPASPNQGWFFVLQEQPSELRFGLDASAHAGGAPATWADLAWGHLANSDLELAAIACIDLDADRPDTRGIAGPAGITWHANRGLGAAGARSSDIAYITYQPPARVALHASDMLPP